MKFSDIRLMDIGNTIQMVGAVYADGNGNGFYFPFPSVRDEGKDPVCVEMTHDDWKALLRQADHVETEVLAQHKDGELYKAIARKSQRQVDSQVQWNVYRRDNFMCRYCGTEKMPLTVDHLVRWEDGGPTIEENLVAACRKCNKVRGDTAYAAWLRHPYYVEVSQKVSIAYQS
jgi:5-methylcytosine-specific restriction endonuclease McrA